MWNAGRPGAISTSVSTITPSSPISAHVRVLASILQFFQLRFRQITNDQKTNETHRLASGDPDQMACYGSPQPTPTRAVTHDAANRIHTIAKPVLAPNAAILREYWSETYPLFRSEFGVCRDTERVRTTRGTGLNMPTITKRSAKPWPKSWKRKVTRCYRLSTAWTPSKW